MPFLHKLSPTECERLLRAGDFGRIGLLGPDGPEIIPVNYIVVKDEIRVRTDQESVLGAYADGAALAFEIEHRDREYWQGWSVVARGIGRVVDVRKCPGHLPRPRANGDRRAILRLRWDQLTGRRLGEDRHSLHDISYD